MKRRGFWTDIHYLFLIIGTLLGIAAGLDYAGLLEGLWSDEHTSIKVHLAITAARSRSSPASMV